MNTVEQQLLSQLDALREGVDPDTVRHAVAALRHEVDALAPDRQNDRAIRALYLYVEAACGQWGGSTADERREIENSLAAALAAARRGGSVFGLSCLPDQLDQLADRIDELPLWPRNILRCLLFYVEEKLRQALDPAVRGVRPESRRLERDRRRVVAATVNEGP